MASESGVKAFVTFTSGMVWIAVIETMETRIDLRMV